MFANFSRTVVSVSLNRSNPLDAATAVRPRASKRASQTSVISALIVAVAFLLSLSLESRDCHAQSANQMAYRKSLRMASLGIGQVILPWKSPHSTAPYAMRHVLPFQRPIGVRAEGVGYSPYSASQALRNSCFFGQRRIAASSVVRGRDGYYATVYYR